MGPLFMENDALDSSQQAKPGQKLKVTPVNTFTHLIAIYVPLNLRNDISFYSNNNDSKK